MLGFSCCSSNILLQSSWDQFQSSLGCFSAAIWKRSDFRDENSGPRSVSRFDLALLIFFPSRKIEERSGVTIIPGNIVFAFAWQAFRSDFRPRLKYESGSRIVHNGSSVIRDIGGERFLYWTNVQTEASILKVDFLAWKGPFTT